MFVLFVSLGLFQMSCLPPHCNSLENPGCCNSGVDSLEITTQDFLDLEDYMSDGRANDDSPTMVMKVYDGEQQDETLVGEAEIEFHNNVDNGPHFIDTTLELDNDGGCHFGATVVFEFLAPDSWDPTVQDEIGVDIIQISTSQFEFADDPERYDIWGRIAVDLYFFWWIS